MDIDEILGVGIGAFLGALIMSIVLSAYIETNYNKIVIHNQECYEISDKIYCEWSEE